MDGHGLNAFEKQVLLDVYIRFSIYAHQACSGIRRTVDFVLVLAEDDDGWRCLLQTLQEIHHLGLLLHVLDRLPSFIDVL